MMEQRGSLLSMHHRRVLLTYGLAFACLTAGFQYRSFAGDFAAGEDVRPDYVRELENSFGKPSQDGFGSTVLHAASTGDKDLAMLARAAYRHFLGGLWEKRGESTWIGQWRVLYDRTDRRDIVGELHDLKDTLARSSADMILDGIQEPATGRSALSTAFDDPAVRELKVYNIGDGEAMSGLVIACRRANGDATFLVFLMD